MNEYAANAKLRMAKTLDNLKLEFTSLRTGKASPAILDRIECDYYGEKMPINQISAISVPEPRQLLITPYDKNDIKAIIAAINSSSIGINPQNESDHIRLVFPPLTEERRRDLVRVAKKFTEEAKIAIRNLRREALAPVKNDKSLSEDLVKVIEKEIQDVTDEAVKRSDELFKEKEKEILQV